MLPGVLGVWARCAERAKGPRRPRGSPGPSQLSSTTSARAHRDPLILWPGTRSHPGDVESRFCDDLGPTVSAGWSRRPERARRRVRRERGGCGSSTRWTGRRRSTVLARSASRPASSSSRPPQPRLRRARRGIRRPHLVAPGDVREPFPRRCPSCAGSSGASSALCVAGEAQALVAEALGTKRFYTGVARPRRPRRTGSLTPPTCSTPSTVTSAYSSAGPVLDRHNRIPGRWTSLGLPGLLLRCRSSTLPPTSMT